MYHGYAEQNSNIQLVQIRPEERLATTSKLNLASSLVTGCGEAKEMGYWAATQVKGLSPEIFIVPEAGVGFLFGATNVIKGAEVILEVIKRLRDSYSDGKRFRFKLNKFDGKGLREKAVKACGIFNAKKIKTVDAISLGIIVKK